MAAQWFCRIGQQVTGPHTSDGLRQLARIGRLTPDCLVRRGESGKWVAASRVKGLFDKVASAAPAPQPASNSGKLKRAKPLAEPALAIPPPPPPPAAPAPPRPGDPAPATVVTVVPDAAPPVPTAANHPGSTPITIITDSDSGADAPPEPRNKPSRATLLALGLSACVVLVLASGMILLYFRDSPRDTKETAAAQRSESEEDLPSDPEADVETDPLPDSADPAAADAGPGSSSADDRAAEEDHRQRVMDSISRWYDASKTRMVGLRQVVRLQIAGVWLDPADGEREGGNDASPSPPQRLYVAVNVINSSAASTLSYTSWNGSGTHADSTRAILIDSQGKACPLVPLSDTPQTDRKRQHDLQPGEMLEDVLVFQAPQSDRDLKLVLPRAAIGRSGYFAFEVPKVMLTAGERPTMARRAGGSAVDSSDDSQVEPVPELVTTARKTDLSPPNSRKEIAEPPQEDRPPSREELNQQIKEYNESEKDWEKKRAEKEAALSEP